MTENGHEAKQIPDEREKALLTGALRGFSKTAPSVSSQKKEGNSPAAPPVHPLSEKTSPQPQSSRRHNRNVSWNDPSIVLSEVTQPGETSPRVRLKDVIGSSPYEDEAEAYIQRSLEETDPMVSEEVGTQKALLGNVPDDVRHSFDNEERQSDLPSVLGERRSTGDALWDMAAQMRKMQERTGSSLRESSHIEEEMSPGDILAHNAMTLLKRNRANKNHEAVHQEREETPEATAASSDPMVKWKKLKYSVQFAGAVGIKKDDDARSADDNAEGGEGSGSEGGDKTSPRKSKYGRAGKATEQLKSEFRDFEEWVQFARPGMKQYIKRILLFLIIPCTGVAALLFYAVGNPPCGTQDECREEQGYFVPGAPTQAPTMAPTILLLNGTNATNATEAPTAAPGAEDEIKKLYNFFRPDKSNQASASWWLLFLGVRQVLTFTAAKATQALVVDYLALRTRWFVKLFGPFVTLFVVQSKGWPFLVFCWALNDFVFLYGDRRFARHWLYWQDAIDLFNETNPSGGITSAKNYLTILGLALGVSALVAIKRFWLALFLGRQTFSRYAESLKDVMEKALLIGQVATLARDMGKYDFQLGDFIDLEHTDVYNRTLNKYDNGSSFVLSREAQSPSSARSVVVENMDKGTFTRSDVTGSISVKINELLGEWEEPETLENKNEDVPISSIIQFRRSISCLNTAFPFSVAFGPADTRENCVASAETVYGRLLSSDRQSKVLSFDALALIAIEEDGSLDKDKLKKLIKLFRPDREGSLTLLDFAKSVDSVYKDLRLLRASVASSSKMDKAFEKILNVFFYFIIFCVVLAVMGVDPLALFASISGFVLGFSFMFGPATSKYFQGLLLILVQRPYDIGDRINVSDVNRDTAGSGSAGWIVKDVTLYHTTVVYGSTSEVATVSNGSLALSRIINHARSPQAVLWFMMKFPYDTPYKKIKVFKGGIEKFIKARPREWLSFAGFRSNRVEIDSGFVEYIIIAVHRESWQSIGALKQSKADLTSFALELSKNMGMQYQAPPLPVDLTMKQGFSNISDVAPSVPVEQRHGVGSAEDVSQGSGSMDIGSIAAMFDQK